MMKRTIYTLLALLLFAACDSNEPKLFERGDTNVYFPYEKMGVAVGNLLSVPVTLAGLPGGSAVAVNFSIKDSTAREGEDYLIHSGYVCNFEKGHGTEYIVIEALPKDNDTIARRMFEIILDPVEGFRANNRNNITVELRNYSRHPLRKLLGDADFRGLDLAQGNAVSEFTVNIYPDDEDPQTLYLSGMTGGVYGGILPAIEMNVDTLTRKIQILPKIFTDRKLGSVSGDIELVKGTLMGNSVGIEGGVPIHCSYDEDGNIYFDDWFGAVWTSGSDDGKALFLFYGYYSGEYRSGILRKE